MYIYRSVIKIAVLLSFLPIFLQAQISVNVQIQQNQQSLKAFFINNHSKKLGSEEKALANQNFGIKNLAYIQTIAKNVTLETKGIKSELFCLSFDESDTTLLLETLNNSQNFTFAELNFPRKIDDYQSSNDPKIGEQWYHPFIKTFEAWQTSRSSSNVVVGVIDTGLDYNHPEFDGQIFVNSLEDINGNGKLDSLDFNGIDDDGNGYIDDVIGYDFTDQPYSPFGGDYLTEDADPQDDNNHGTLVSGIIAAKSDNNFGGTGIAPDCKIMPIRAFSASGIGEDDDIARAIIYATDMGVKIINMSFGDIYPSQMMHLAIKYAYTNGVIMIASAGNATGDNVHYPSNFDETISVSASDKDLNDNEFLWPLSSYGLTVDLCAPGSQIYAPKIFDPNDSEDQYFGTYSGTSTSAPMVSAAAAILFSQNPSITPQQFRGIITASSDDIQDDGWDQFTGAGRLNIRKALDQIGASHVEIISPENDFGTDSSAISIVATILEPLFVDYSLEYTFGDYGSTNWQTISSGNNLQNYNDTIANWNISTLPDGIYTLRLKVNKTNGTTAEDRKRIIIDRTKPSVEIKLAEQIWDNNERKILIVYRSSDNSVNTLFFRELGSLNYSKITADKTTKNGDFLIGKEILMNGDYEFFIQSTNFSGLVDSSILDTFSFKLDYISFGGFSAKNYNLPGGQILNQTYDFDQNGNNEIVMSEFNESLSFGKIKFYEFNSGNFTLKDSISSQSILIPKDVADTDNNGKLELLCNVQDSLFIFEQNSSTEFPNQLIYSNFNNGFYPTKFVDVDQNGSLELITKDYKDYYVFQGSGSNYSQVFKLQDNTSVYIGSTAPKIAVSDLDNNGKKEISYGDFDGDLIVYENEGSASNFTEKFTLETDLYRSAPYIHAGDFDGDGIDEIFMATHQTKLRNESDFEYLTLYWHLRVLKNIGGNLVTVWEDFINDVDSETQNGASQGDIDNDGRDEIILSIYPRTYVVDFDAVSSTYKFRWFFYGSLSTSHITQDFDQNGLNELGLIVADSLSQFYFFEVDTNYNPYQEVALLNAYVLDSNKVRLNWNSYPSANYTIFRGKFGDTQLFSIGTTNINSYIDTTIQSDSSYIYLVQIELPADTFTTNSEIITAKSRNQITAIKALNKNTLSLTFKNPLNAQNQNIAYFNLNDQFYPISIADAGQNANRLIIGFTENFNLGTNSLTIDTLLRDNFRCILIGNDSLKTFEYFPDTTEYVYLTKWNSISENQAILQFNKAMDLSVENFNNYQIQPFGEIIALERQTNSNQVKITIQNAVFGAVGYSVSIIVNNVQAQDSSKILVGEGNVATFNAFKEKLDEVYVYPNPVKKISQLGGLSFANLTKTATIHVYTVSGQKVQTLYESDGDGGLTWDMKDLRGNRILPGVYMFVVQAKDVEDFIGKFSILE